LPTVPRSSLIHILEWPRNTGFTQSEMEMIRQFEEGERRASGYGFDEEDYGSDLEGIVDAYDSEEDYSFECLDWPGR
jgi:hypothetical protein